MSEPWLCFDLDMKEAAARERFKAKFGCDPARVKIERGLLWVGPISEGEPLESE